MVLILVVCMQCMAGLRHLRKVGYIGDEIGIFSEVLEGRRDLWVPTAPQGNGGHPSRQIKGSNVELYNAVISI